MSTTTNFKRIALVAVAALGLGVLSSVPSSAQVTAPLVTLTNGTATTAKSDSTTGATVAVSFLADAGVDTMSVKVSIATRPSTLSTVQPKLLLIDTLTAASVVDTDAASAQAGAPGTFRGVRAYNGSQVGPNTGMNVGRLDTSLTTSVTLGATFKIWLDTSTGDIVAGTYVFNVSSVAGFAGSAGTETVQQVSIVVSTASNLSLVANSTNSTAIISANSATADVDATFVNDSTTDSASVTAPATSANVIRAVIRVALKNASGGNAAESITVSTDRGLLADAGTPNARGKQLVIVDNEAYEDINIYSDGTSGKATITISTPSVTFAAKTVTFYSTTATKITAAVYSAVIDASEIGVAAVATDSNGNSLSAATDVYAYSSDTSVVSNYGTACTWNATAKAALCALIGLKNGTANITIRDASTVALSTIASNAVAVKVNLNAAASVKLSFNKATYAPNEKATVLIKVYDASGELLAPNTYTNLFASGGITSSVTLGANVPNSPALTVVNIATAVNAAAEADTPIVTTEAVAQRTFYMPASGVVTLNATGGTSLASAGQVAVTASATVVDSGASALAAVAALQTTVASLRTLIVTLTNLVLKIQKKVKA